MMPVINVIGGQLMNKLEQLGDVKLYRDRDHHHHPWRDDHWHPFLLGILARAARAVEFRIMDPLPASLLTSSSSSRLHHHHNHNPEFGGGDGEQSPKIT